VSAAAGGPAAPRDGRLRTIALTGASSGIGAALAAELSQPGVRLALAGREAARLDEVAAACRSKGAVVETALVDVRDRAVLHAWLAGVDAAGEIDVLIANAGVSAGLGPKKVRERDEDVRRLVEVNLIGAIDTVSGLVEAMRARRRGHIVIVASVAGLRGYPAMPTYSATKAALIAYGEAIRGWLRPSGIAVTVVCPGFVTSPMSARHKGSKPFEMSADRAARIIAHGIARKRAVVAFPFLLALGARLSRLLPAALSDRAFEPFAAKIERDPRADVDGRSDRE
jgi:short-subunit dehydrogenase